ncbi:hypothetical protein SAMN06269173_104261 [Hymenobacter mucosus]|uniref:Uncharacterized protein n=1 Tax=Hymenobacter mucosus TaxID=1411120 RepID=A0A238XRA5_9BACT|nr:hypothetical protein SAMN06269173_104261 [Hymenobacter mucosus]
MHSHLNSILFQLQDKRRIRREEEGCDRNFSLDNSRR